MKGYIDTLETIGLCILLGAVVILAFTFIIFRTWQLTGRNVQLSKGIARELDVL